jgi:Zn-dependent metalloprotease
LKKQIFILLFISCFTFVSTFAIGSELTIEELSIVEKLFKINDLKQDENIKVIRVQETRLGATVITCDQFYEGLLVVDGEFNYTFKPDGTSHKQSYLAERLIKNQEVDVDINPIISKEEALQLFVEKTRSYGWDLSTKKIVEEMLDNNSLNIVLGIYDKNVFKGITITDYILVWQVRFENKKYPYAIIDASNGNYLKYDSGIRN